jgi:hypothetical protein
MPISVPVNVFPVVVATLTVLSTNAATSVKNFRCATDNFKPPVNLTKGLFNYLSLILVFFVYGLFVGFVQLNHGLQ